MGDLAIEFSQIERRDVMGDTRADNDESSLDVFIQELTATQSNLRAYVRASVGGNENDVADVLQRTNLLLWKNAAKFRPDAPFLPWAITLAKYEVLSFCRDRSRDRHVFPEDLATLMSEAAEETVTALAERKEALEECLESLPRKQHELLLLRYFEGKRLSQIAEVRQQSVDAVTSRLSRVRRALQRCIENRLKAIS